MEAGLLLRLAPLPLLLAALSLGGCATLNESECLNASWSDIGYRDGRTGHSPDRISDHTEACQKYGVAPDRKDYLAGRDEGLVQYCTRHNGFEVGLANGSYEGVCATMNERAFIEGFNKGKALYEARARLDQVESEIARVDEKRDEKGLSDEVRDELIDQRIRLEGKRVAAREQVERLEYETQRF